MRGRWPLIAVTIAGALLGGPVLDWRLAAASAPGAADDLVDLLGRFDKGDVAAADALMAKGLDAVPAMIERLAGSDQTLAASAIRVLAGIGAPAVARLAEAARFGTIVARVNAIVALSKVAEAHDEPIAALGALLTDADPDVRAAAATGLFGAGLRAKPAGPALKTALGDKSTLVRITAAAAAIRSGYSGQSGFALPVLMAGLTDPQPPIRRVALYLFTRCGLPAARVNPVLIEATRDADAFVRLTALQSLVESELANGLLIDLFVKAAASKDAEERDFARDVLPKLTDVPLPELLHLGGPMRGDRLRHLKSMGSASASPSEKAVAAALDWLARHQSPDGRWDCDGFDAQCKGGRCDSPGESEHDTGVTGLALLAFLGAGESHLNGRDREVVARGIGYLRSIQDVEGCIGSRRHEESLSGIRVRRPSDHFLYGHAIATLALCDCYLLTQDEVLRESAQRAVDFIVRAQNPRLAWRYDAPPNGDNDTSITGWMTWALAVAQAAGLTVDKSAIPGAVAWIDKMTEPEFGRTGYRQRGGPPTRSDEMMAKFPSDKCESLTAVGVLVRILAGHTPNDDEYIVKGADLIKKKPPKWDIDAGTIDFYYWQFGALAMFQMGDDDGSHWQSWIEPMKLAILEHQQTAASRDDRGSWNPIDCWSADGGRVYSTAMNCMTLEAPWRMNRMLRPK